MTLKVLAIINSEKNFFKKQMLQNGLTRILFIRSKIKRIIGKVDETAPHEVLLVLDAGTGQNALSQAEQFKKVIDVSGIALTKLDGKYRCRYSAFS